MSNWGEDKVINQRKICISQISYAQLAREQTGKGGYLRAVQEDSRSVGSQCSRVKFIREFSTGQQRQLKPENKEEPGD